MITKKIIVFYHHHGSYGHTRRVLHLIEALSTLPLEIVVISGGEITVFTRELFSKSVKLIELPLLTSDIHFKSLTPVDSTLSLDQVKHLRLKTINESILHEMPDILCCEFFPFGRHQIAEEFTVAIELVRKQKKKTFVISSMRDILGVNLSTEKREKIKRYLPLFDEILIHGDQDFLKFDQTLTPFFQNKIKYTGYLAQTPPERKELTSQKTILISLGGGRDGQKIIEIIFQLARELPDYHFKLITGEFSPHSDFLETSNLEVLKSSPDFMRELRQADFFISMCGYNTFCEAYLSQVPTLFIPRDFEPEQLLRAREASLQIKWMSYIPLSEVTLKAISLQIQMERPQITATCPINMNGLEIVQHYLKSLIT